MAILCSVILRNDCSYVISRAPACAACKRKDRMAWWIVAVQIIETVDMPK